MADIKFFHSSKYLAKEFCNFGFTTYQNRIKTIIHHMNVILPNIQLIGTFKWINSSVVKS